MSEHGGVSPGHVAHAHTPVRTPLERDEAKAAVHGLATQPDCLREIDIGLGEQLDHHLRAAVVRCAEEQHACRPSCALLRRGRDEVQRARAITRKKMHRVLVYWMILFCLAHETWTASRADEGKH
jgi:hypothetical protein